LFLVWLKDIEKYKKEEVLKMSRYNNNSRGIVEVLVGVFIGYFIYKKWLEPWIARGGADNFLKKIKAFLNKGSDDTITIEKITD
jgi:hypothetical protein